MCCKNINKQIVNIADENLTDYRFLSRYHCTKSNSYSKRRYRINHWSPMFIGTPCKWFYLKSRNLYLFFSKFWQKERSEVFLIVSWEETRNWVRVLRTQTLINLRISSLWVGRFQIQYYYIILQDKDDIKVTASYIFALVGL